MRDRGRSPRSRRRSADHAEGIALEALLDALDADRREAFVLTQLVGLSYAEAADVAGCPVGTIRSRVARARDDLVAGFGGTSRLRRDSAG